MSRARLRDPLATRTEQLQVSAWHVACDERDELGGVSSEAPTLFVNRYRAAPLVAHAAEIREAVSALPVLERLVRERTNELEAELRVVRREAVLLSARLAALGFDDLGRAA
jgi:hypothetical protein